MTNGSISILRTLLMSDSDYSSRPIRLVNGLLRNQAADTGNKLPNTSVKQLRVTTPEVVCTFDIVMFSIASLSA